MKSERFQADRKTSCFYFPRGCIIFVYLTFPFFPFFSFLFFFIIINDEKTRSVIDLGFVIENFSVFIVEYRRECFSLELFPFPFPVIVANREIYKKRSLAEMRNTIEKRGKDSYVINYSLCARCVTLFETDFLYTICDNRNPCRSISNASSIKVKIRLVFSPRRFPKD